MTKVKPIQATAAGGNGTEVESLFRPDANGDEPKRLATLRQTEFTRFTELGLPSIHEEDWRFTNVSALRDLSLRPPHHAPVGAVSSETINRHPFGGLSGHRLVFVNGLLVPSLSSFKEEDGLKLTNLSEALSKQSALVLSHLGRATHERETSLASLNTALFRDGAFVYISAGKKVEEPIHLFYISTAEKEGESTFYPRNLIVAERGAKFTLTESYFGSDDSKGLTDAVTELVIGDEVHAEYVKLQEESAERYHLATISAHMGRASQVRIHSFALGGKLSRTNIHATLAGEGMECILNGLYAPQDHQLADHYMVVDHAVPHGASHEYFNGILSGHAKGVFHGRIIVRPDAQKTDAKQTNKNLLLSETATANTKPQLEIYADDVKCTHGATIGQLNEESIFYLRARGIPLAMARWMLINAFAGEILDRVENEAIRAAVYQVVSKRLESHHG